MLPFRTRPGFNLVMAPYGILQSLTREAKRHVRPPSSDSYTSGHAFRPSIWQRRAGRVQCGNTQVRSRRITCSRIRPGIA